MLPYLHTGPAIKLEVTNLTPPLFQLVTLFDCQLN